MNRRSCRRYSVPDALEKPRAFEFEDRVPEFFSFVSLTGQPQNKLGRCQAGGMKIDDLQENCEFNLLRIESHDL